MNDTIKRAKREATTREKISAIYTTDKSLVFRACKEILQIKKWKTDKFEQTLLKRKYTNKLENINLAVRKMQIKLQ